MTSQNPDAVVERYEAMQSNPMPFLECLFTLDQVDKANPIKRFPAHWPYIKLYTQVWLEENFIAVPKSRRMHMTWTNIALYLWDTIFHFGRHNAIVSKKENDSAELINRAEFLFDNIDPKMLPPELLPKKKTKFGLLEFHEINSKLQGFPSGADQLRQYTFSGIMADEIAFWDNAREFYSSSVPTLEGGGRLTCISSRAPGFFKRLVFDEFDIAV